MRISEVSERCGISSDTLRYYERVGLIPPVDRDPGGIRKYSETDMKRIEFVKCMRRVDLPIEVLTEYFRLVQQGDETIDARKDILQTQRDQLQARMDEMQDTLDLLNHKIRVYEDLILARERELALAPEFTDIEL